MAASSSSWEMMRRHAVRAGVAVRARSVCAAQARRAARGVADEGVLDVLAGDGAVRVPAAVLGAEAAMISFTSAEVSTK